MTEVMQLFRMAGTFLAKSIVDDKLIDLPISGLMWDLLLGKVSVITNPTTYAMFFVDRNSTCLTFASSILSSSATLANCRLSQIASERSMRCRLIRRRSSD